jgi:NSS family neurotransmitter:Na+ symporter
MENNRGNFSGRIGFILAAAGSAVGLGNIWRFPYLAGQNGGAAFLFIYLAFIFLLCYPVMAGEIAIGRAAGSDAMGSYTKLGNRRWGYLACSAYLRVYLFSPFTTLWQVGHSATLSKLRLEAC